MPEITHLNIFHHFKRGSLNQIKQFFEGESPTLKLTSISHVRCYWQTFIQKVTITVTSLLH